MHIRHCECPQATQAHKLSPLFLTETVACKLYHLQRETFVRHGHVMVDKELAKTSSKPQEKLPFIGFYGILPCREPVKILLEGRMVHIIHNRSFNFHSPHFDGFLDHIVLQQGFNKPAFRIIAHVT